MNELALFAGAGGGLLGSHLLGHTPVCAVELDEYARRVLLARQQDGHLPRFPIWDDVRTFDGKPWRGRVDIITGGFPCQDISSAGKGEGLTGARSGLWFEMQRIIGEVRPKFVFAENSPRLRTLGLGTVIDGLTRLGYDSRWGVLGAGHVGAPHRRNRMWVLAADAHGQELWDKPGRGSWEVGKGSALAVEYGREGVMADAAKTRSQNAGESKPGQTGQRGVDVGGHEAGSCHPVRFSWETESLVGRVADVVADRVDRLKAIGNGQVPAVAALAWQILGGPVA